MSTETKWGLGHEADARMTLLESVLQRHNEAVEYSFEATGDEEAREIIADGVANFLEASADVTPYQRLMVGMKFCLHALAEWKAHGPEGKPPVL